MTNTSNESEAMEVWLDDDHPAMVLLRAVDDAYASYMGDPDGNDDTHSARQAAARVIATALEAKDAEIARLDHCLTEANAQHDKCFTELVYANVRIRELEGALNLLITDCGYHLRKYRLEQFNEARAILTKGKTHD